MCFSSNGHSAADTLERHQNELGDMKIKARIKMLKRDIKLKNEKVKPI